MANLSPSISTRSELAEVGSSVDSGFVSGTTSSAVIVGGGGGPGSDLVHPASTERDKRVIPQDDWGVNSRRIVAK